MRTTIRLDDDLLRQVKDRAAKSGCTITAVIEDALRAFLAKRRTSRPRRRVALTTVKGRGLQPGVNLDSMADLLDLMDRHHATD